ncbi:pancreatic secretory granule membrane major glycoprotein GP2-like isoform X2 [Mixophyes fleayi]|uniref:pancreatic secretory granule membrane major glycoprotein GP2-like isoform X2 n=1 Tax=Mixophyes fleayi TaxID=3061075 RepID=UPI003F4DEA00
MSYMMAFLDFTKLLIALLGTLTLVSPQGIQRINAEDDVDVFYREPWPNGDGAVTVSGGACPTNLCRNGGLCQMIGGKPQCLCKPGFTNHNCQDMKLDLSCDEDGMKLKVQKSILHELSINTSILHTFNPQCKVQDTSNLHVSVTLTHANHTLCGTRVKVNGTHLIYSNALTTSSEKAGIPGTVISRSADVKIGFSCVYPYDRVVSLPFPLLTSDSLVTFLLKEGEFNVSMTLHPTAEFLEPYEHPPVLPLIHRLYIQLQIHGHSPQDFFTLKLEECWATPGADHGGKFRHLLISNGQDNDSTVDIIKSEDKSLSRFSLQMFRFVDYPEFYLHCRIWLCQPNTTQCCERPRPNAGRQRRDLVDPYRKVVSCGPIRLVRNVVSSAENPESGLSPFILPGSLAAGAILLLLCLVAVAKAKTARPRPPCAVLYPRPFK